MHTRLTSPRRASVQAQEGRHMHTWLRAPGVCRPEQGVVAYGSQAFVATPTTDTGGSILPGCPDASHPQGLPWGSGLRPSVWRVSYWQPTSFLSLHRTVSHRTAPSGGHNLSPLRPVVRGRTPPSRGIDTPHASHLQGTARLPGCFASAGLYLAAQTLRFRTTSHHTARHRNVSHRTARLECIMYSLQPVVRGMAPPSRGIGAPYASHLQGTAGCPDALHPQGFARLGGARRRESARRREIEPAI